MHSMLYTMPSPHLKKLLSQRVHRNLKWNNLEIIPNEQLFFWITLVRLSITKPFQDRRDEGNILYVRNHRKTKQVQNKLLSLIKNTTFLITRYIVLS